MNSKLSRKLLQYSHEPVRFSLNFKKAWEEELHAFIENTGFTLGETFFMGTQSLQGPFVVVAELVV